MGFLTFPFAVIGNQDATKDTSSSSRMGALRSRPELAVNAIVSSASSRVGALRSSGALAQSPAIPITAESRLGALRGTATAGIAQTTSTSSTARVAPLRSSGLVGVNAVIRSYVSDGDTNGIFYWLGTDGETTTFVNPATDGTITSTATSILSDDAALHGPNNLTDRLVVGNSNVATTKNLMVNEAFTVDLTPTGYTYTIDRVTYRGRESFAHAPRNWAFEGSTDGVTWITLAINENETALGGDDEGWFSNVITQFHPPLSYVRIIQTGAGSSGDLYLVMGELEIYGTIYGV